MGFLCASLLGRDAGFAKAQGFRHRRGMNPALDFLADLAACLRFYSRLPVPALPFETEPHAMPDFGRVVRALPVAGALIGAVGALALTLLMSLELPHSFAAAGALAALVAATGAFHEDGLADTADGFGGGATRERKLVIMKDSRIGTYGAAALILSLLLRWQAILFLLVSFGATFAGLAMISIAALSRTVALMPLATLEPARDDGAAWRAGRPRGGPLLVAALLAIALAFLPVWDGASARQCAGSIVLAFAASAFVTRLSLRQIGGQTGDVAGAAQQAAEIAGLAAFLIGSHV